MKHKEFKLTVKNDIFEDAGWTYKAVRYQAGDVITVDETTFDIIQSGNTIERPTHHGFIRFNKYDFLNEVEVTTVTVEYSIRKLGQRNNKKVS
jgi:hypothetical protein